MPRTRAEFMGGFNIAAFLDTISVTEGTDNGTQPTFDDGYDVLVGGGLFTDYAAHPNRLIALPLLGVKSTAAGRYQILKRTWDEMAGLLGLENFFPRSQDAACVRLLHRRGAYLPIQAGDFAEGLNRARKEWASLPGAGYGQREESFERVREIYLSKGGKIGEAA